MSNKVKCSRCEGEFKNNQIRYTDSMDRHFCIDCYNNILDEQFILDVMQEKITVDEQIKLRFKVIFKRLLKKGRYPEIRKGEYGFSSKNPEKAKDLLSKFDTIIENLFIKVEIK
jgi:hypothetical protein